MHRCCLHLGLSNEGPRRLTERILPYGITKIRPARRTGISYRVQHSV